MKNWIAVTIFSIAMLAMSCSMDSADLWDAPPESEYLIEIDYEQELLNLEDVPVLAQEDKQKWGKQVNQFAHTYAIENFQGTDNFVISPTALYSGLAMAAYGAQGTTYQEIADALHWEDERSDALDLSAAMQLNLRFDGQNENSRYVMANQFWADEHLLISEQFKSAMQTIFKVPVQICNFLDYTFYVIDVLNHWMQDITNQFIAKLTNNDSYGTETFMLVNATRFEGNWAFPFDSSKTKKKVFHGLRQDNVVDFMHLIYDFKYYENVEKGYQAVILPYKDELFDMVVILPNDNETAQSVIHNLTAEDFGLISVEAENTQLIDVSLPKFGVSGNSFDMINNLENIGIQEAFFTGFAQFDISDSSTGFIYINKVLHQAVLTVDENGTNSYKALEVTSDKTDPEKDVISFHVNHAFAFAVTHRSSGAVVYLGLMNDIGEN